MINFVAINRSNPSIIMMFRNITERVAALAAALVTASMAWGAPVTPEQALARLARPDAPARVKGNGNAMRLTHTFKTSDTPSAYVFARSEEHTSELQSPR